MQVALLSPEHDPESWRLALQQHLPDIVLHAGPEVPDPAAVEVALAWNPPAGALRGFPRLKLIQCLGMGVDALFADPALPTEPALARLIDDDLIAQMSEYVCWSVLHQHRLIDAYLRQQAAGTWQTLPPPDTASCRVGILGLGTIGADIAAKLTMLGFPVHGWSRTEKFVDQVHSFAGAANLDAFLAQSDILICVLPLTDQTRGIVGRELIDRLPQNAYFINVARGGHVVDADLLAALDNGRLAGATLDVVNQEPLPPEHPYWSQPKVKLTPHIAGLTRPETSAAQIAENIRRVGRGERPLNEVNATLQY